MPVAPLLADTVVHSTIGAVHGLVSLGLLALGTTVVVRPKTRRARHPRLGTWYAAIMLPDLVLALLVGARNPGLSVFEIVTYPTIALVAVGWWAGSAAGRRVLGDRWIAVHASGMGGSLIAAWTAFAFQTVARALPPTVWATVLVFAVPSVVGSPLIGRAIARRRRPRPLPAAASA